MIWGLESGEEELVETEEMEEIMLHMGGRYMEQPGEPRGLGDVSFLEAAKSGDGIGWMGSYQIRWRNRYRTTP